MLAWIQFEWGQFLAGSSKLTAELFDFGVDRVCLINDERSTGALQAASPSLRAPRTGRDQSLYKFAKLFGFGWIGCEVSDVNFAGMRLRMVGAMVNNDPLV